MIETSDHRAIMETQTDTNIYLNINQGHSIFVTTFPQGFYKLKCLIERAMQGFPPLQIFHFH